MPTLSSKLSGIFFPNIVAFSQYINFMQFVDLEFDIGNGHIHWSNPDENNHN